MSESGTREDLALLSPPQPGSGHPQVTHNRLTGLQGSRGVLGTGPSWLHAFHWSLFCDPILVWDAREVSGLTGSPVVASVALGNTSQSLQWIVTCSPAGSRHVG